MLLLYFCEGAEQEQLDVIARSFNEELMFAGQ